MSQALRRASAFLSHPAAFAAFLLALCAAAYAPLLTRLGFFWDDFPILWIGATMGGEGLERYFSTNRPVWGLLYRVTVPLLGSSPLPWHIFALLLRWVTGLALWALLRAVWAEEPRQAAGHPQAGGAWVAAAAAALFVVYPGFSGQFAAFLFSHFYMVLTAFLLSLLLTVLALRRQAAGRRTAALLLSAGALLLALFNVLAMEYFFLLELLRPLLIWTVLSQRSPDRRARLRQALRAWLPYLALFAGAMYWRSALFGFHTYQPALMSRLRADPLQAIGQLIPTALHDIWTASAGAWAQAFRLPDPVQAGAGNMLRYAILVGAAAAGSLLFFLLIHRQDRPEAAAERRRAWQPAALGAAALLVAGGPFWLTDLKVLLHFPLDRFTLPFMVGASLLGAALLALLPAPRWMRAGLLAIGLGFAVGLQFQNALHFRSDWNAQRVLFWQMTWRMPGLEPGTALLSNELPLAHYTDNSLTAALNWTFDPRNRPEQMRYALLYPTLRRSQRLHNFAPDRVIEIDYLATRFTGSTNQMVAFVYNPPGCMRVLDPEIDPYNWMIPTYLRESLALASPRPILAAPPAGMEQPRPPEHIYGPEIPRGWCYFFEQADLARQQRDWETVSRLGDEAFAQADYPNDPLERFPFIEGYAHTGRWEDAAAQSRSAHQVSPAVMQPLVCRLWQRIDRETAGGAADNPGRAETLQTMQTELNCSQILP